MPKQINVEDFDEEDFVEEQGGLPAIPEDIDVEWLTERVLKYCETQAGVDLYPYQREFASRVIESIVLNDGEEITALFSRQCIPEGSIIHTRDGELMRIEDHPNSWKTRENADLVEIRGKGGYVIRCTKNHPVMTKDMGWVPAGMIKEGDYIEVLESWDRFGDGVVEYELEQFVNMQRTDVRKGRVEMSEELAELLGWLVADGYIDLDSGQSIKFTNTSGEYLARVRYLVEKYFKDIEIKEYKKGKGKDLILSTDSNNRHNSLKDFLKAMDFDKDGFPKAVNRFTRAQVEAYFRGLWAGDGYIHLKKGGKNIELGLSCGNSRVFAEFHRELLNKLGIRGQIKEEWQKKSTRPFYRIVCSGQRNARIFNETIGEIMGKPMPDLGYSRENELETHREIDGENMTYTHIVYVNDGGKADTYDVEYPGKGWFIYGGTKVHNSGKTEAIAVVIQGVMVIIPKLARMPQFEPLLGHLKDGIRIGLFAPSGEQAYTTFSRAKSRIMSKNAEMILQDPEIDTRIDKEGNPIVLSNGSFFRMQSAAKQANIESKTYDVLIIEEAQDVDKTKVLKSIHPMGASTNATIIKIGTPNNKRCEFLETVLRNKRKDANRRGGQDNHYEYDYKIVQKYNKRYKKYVEKEKERMGEDSDEFRMSYRLEWLLERGMFVTDQMFEDMMDRRLKHRLQSSKPTVAGIDVGKRRDSTVVTIAEVDMNNVVVDEVTGEVKPYKQIINWLELRGDDYETQYHEIIEFLENYPEIRTIYIDSTGVGTPIADRLTWGMMDKGVQVVAYDFNIPNKSVMWKTLQTEIRAGRLKVAAHAKTRRLRAFKKFERQMLDLEKDYRNQYMVCQHPDEKDAHDDYCDSLALCCLAAHEKAMPEVEITNNFLF